MVGTLTATRDRQTVWAGPEALLCHAALPGNVNARSALQEDGGRRIAFWGALHDAQALRPAAEPRDPSETPDDAGLALSLFARDGIDALKRLDGSFALAIHDAQSGELVVANDRFSSRPLYWATTGSGDVVFGSQVHTVLQHPRVSRELNRRSVFELMHYQRVHGTRTLNAAVQMLPPGTILRVTDGRARVLRWFQMTYRPEALHQEEWMDEMASAFKTSTRRSMEGAEKVGLLLSGGLDSRMVVAATDRDLHCYHFNDHHNQEFERARRIAAIEDHAFTYLPRPANHYAELFDAAVDVGDGHYSFVHGHPIGLLPHDEVDVMLHGFAPELYFRGTNLPHKHVSFMGKEIWSGPDLTLAPDEVALEIVTRLKYSQSSIQPWRFFREEADAFEDEMLSSARELVDEARIYSPDPNDWFIWADTYYHCKYPSFLFEAAIRPSQHERSIVFHNHILDLHLRMPVQSRADSRVWAGALQRLSPDVAKVPDANTGYSPLMAPVVVTSLTLAGRAARRLRPVKPRWTPGQTSTSWPNFSEYIVVNKALRNLVEGVLRDPEALDPSLFDLSYVERVLAEHLSGLKNHATSLLLLATFGGWHKKYGPPARRLP